jgi:hypothetical protein
LVSIDEILPLKREGYTVRGIAEKLGVSVSTVSNRIAEWSNEVKKQLPEKIERKSAIKYIPLSMTKSVYDKLCRLSRRDLKEYISRKINDNLDDVLGSLSDINLVSVEKPGIRIKIPIHSDDLDKIRDSGVLTSFASVILACISGE